MPTRASIRVLLFLLLVTASSLTHAQEATPAPATTVLKTLVVTGEQPGPGLWKVSHGDHVMWILGTLSPLPKRMRWTSRNVEATIAASQEVLMMPSVEMKPDGMTFGAIFLIPKLLKARNNPDGAKLVDMVPPELYARWLVLKQRYLGRDSGVEKRRPIMAAGKLQDEAMDDSDLSTKNIAADVVRRAAKKHDVPVTVPRIEITIKDPKGTLSEFAASSLDDVECFRKTIERLESDIETMKLRANAWALGEVAILRRLTTTETYRACTSAFLETQLAKRQGFDDLEARVDAAWISAAAAALEKNKTTFALLPMPLMLGEARYVDALTARGYVVEAPDADEAGEAEEATDATPSSPQPPGA
jgi:hypothetical protein